MIDSRIGEKMYGLCGRIFPICRSITGNGVRETFKILQAEIPDIPFEMHEVPSGTKVLDWTVPKEWNIRDAYIETPSGKRICEFSKNNLNILHYSLPIDKVISLSELKEHITTLPDQPDLIPYASSYYKERWGFCMSQNDFDRLEDGDYHVFIDSTLEDGSLTYGEILIKGETDEEIMFSSYTCHPSMANNECSGPVVLTNLARYIKDMPKRRYSYRLVLAPETIGAITYISKNLDHLKKHVKAAFNLTCVGDNRTYSIVHSRYSDTLADKILVNVLSHHYPEYKDYSYLERGSDERQYQAPGVDIPMVCFCRSKYHVYPEYHTSADNMSIISAEGLAGAYEVMIKSIKALEYNRYYKVQTLGEPQLGKRGLVPTMSSKDTYKSTLALKDLIAYADGRNDLIDISNIIKVPLDILYPLIDKLMDCGLFAYED
ncbi:DUF4910 domain-containing protein [Lachnospiraceae bacterium C1.1]|nr:DUF4910 domain-containing protein [Lachnospiraceae bacterium C1.1]